MKQIIGLIASLAFVQIANAKGVEKGTEEITLSIEYATMPATVACITKYHPQSEGEESPELFFMNTDEFLKFSELTNEGYSMLRTLRGGQSCTSDSLNMPHVSVGLYDKIDAIKDAVKAQKAAVPGTLIFYKGDQLSDDLNQQKSEVLKALLQ